MLVPVERRVALRAADRRRTRAVVFDDTGHVPMIERPSRFNELLSEFLAGDPTPESRASRGAQRVMAPSAALDDELARTWPARRSSYVARRRLVGGDARGRSPRRRASTSMRRFSTSIVIVSPSRTAAIGPPTARLGGDVAGHEAARGAGEAAVGEQRDVLAEARADERRGDGEHLAHAGAAGAGPRCGSRRRRRRLIAPAVTAAIASSSRSKTRAGPSWWTRSWPASFTTEPSGARLPRRIARPPVVLSGSSSGRTTSWPGVSLRLAGVLADRPAGDGLGVLVQDARPRAGAGRRRATPPAS